MKNLSIGVMAFAMIALVVSSVSAQNLTLPRGSQEATVIQKIGLTEVSINYHRPGVRDREIWGSLVPYGMSPGVAFGSGNEFPWRAGANDNTTISFSHDVKIEGTPVPAGTYGLHMVPGEADWVVILTTDTEAWGSFFYDPANDVAKVAVQAEAAAHEEWLSYGFDNLTANSGTAYLHWEKLRVPFNIEVNTQEVVLEYLRGQLTHLAAFNWNSLQAAANYCLNNDINHEEAIGWIDRSIANNKNVNNMGIKARLLDQMDRTADAETVMQEAFDHAEQTGVEADMNAVGYIYLFSDRVDKAIDVFRLNVKNFPDAWNVYDSLGEGLERKGNRDGAIKNYKIALEKAPAGQKARIQGILDGFNESS